MDADGDPRHETDDLPWLTVAEVMVRSPKTLSSGISVGDARAAFRDDHVHMVLLTDADILRGTLVRTDIVDADDGEPALAWAQIAGRTVPPSASAEATRRTLVARGERRLAVVGEGGRLLGLLCLKRRLTGFCSDDDVRARALDREGTACVAPEPGRLSCAMAIVVPGRHHDRPDSPSQRDGGWGAS